MMEMLVAKQSLTRFEWSVRALAQPADVQIGLFPSFVCVADELALEFEECLRGLRASGWPVLGEVTAAIETLDSMLESMSGAENMKFWCDEALALEPEWERVRCAAMDVIMAMRWSTSPPSPSERSYVGPP